jgi:hypothetical protein
VDYWNDEPNHGGAYHFPVQVRGIDSLRSHVSLQST